MVVMERTVLMQILTLIVKLCCLYYYPAPELLAVKIHLKRVFAVVLKHQLY